LLASHGDPSPSPGGLELPAFAAAMIAAAACMGQNRNPRVQCNFRKMVTALMLTKIVAQRMTAITK
jgi:hypothetical protein